MTSNTSNNDLATVRFLPIIGPREGSFVGKNGRRISFIIVNDSDPGFKIPSTLDD